MRLVATSGTKPLIFLKKYSKVEIRDAASTAITDLMNSLGLVTPSKKVQRLTKDITKKLSRQIAEDQRKQLKKVAKASAKKKKDKSGKRKKKSIPSVPPVN